MMPQRSPTRKVGVPLLVECGGVYQQRLREELPDAYHTNVDELRVGGLLAALDGGAVRTGDEILGVTPVRNWR